MRLHDINSVEIDATFDVGAVGEDGRFEVTIESAGGSVAGGNRRNPDYPRLLEVLLRRASAMGAVIEDAVVSSSRVANLPLADRRIHVEGRPYPIALGAEEDFSEFRRLLTRPQVDIGSARKVGGGNQRKRMTITFRVADPVDRSHLISRLGVKESSGATLKSGVASGLSREDVLVALDRVREVGRDRLVAELGRPEVPRFIVGDGDDVAIDAMTLILSARALAGMTIEGPWMADSSDVASPLRDMGFAIADLERPLEAPLGKDPAKYVGLAKRLGGTDVALLRMGRREQQFLRGALGLGSGDPSATSQCGMCGRVLPQSLLVAAHIKPRHACSDEERLDMPHVGWALCLLGCDALFEQAYLGVAEDGRLLPLRTVDSEAPQLRELVESMAGTVAVGWDRRRDRYFAVHRAMHARKS